MRTFIFSAKFEHLDDLRKFVGQAAMDACMDDSEIYSIQLAVDEAASNIVEHACNCQEGEQIECTCEVEKGTLTVILHDHGNPFDPTQVPDPDISTNLQDRKVGGLGIFLMRHLMDKVSYESLGETGNNLTLVKRHRSSV